MMGLLCNDSQLARNREPRVTPTLVTVVLAALLVGACGGGSSKAKGGAGDRYAKAGDLQSACCEQLDGAPRDQCLAGVVKVDDAAVAQTTDNEATYGCVTQHFVCDPATGHPTQASAQAQFECIEDLGPR